MRAHSSHRPNWLSLSTLPGAALVTMLGLSALVPAAEGPAPPPQPGALRLGIVCREIPSELRPHLALPADQGMLIQQVQEGSPADQAGLRPNDLLVSINDKPLHQLPELIEAVQTSAGQSLRLVVLRTGQTQTIEVQPMAQPVPALPTPPGHFPNRLGDLLRQKYKPGKANRLYFRPGPMLLVEPSEPLPPQLEIEIKTNDQQQASLRVRMGDQTWQLTAKDVDQVLAELPPSLRPSIERLAQYLGISSAPAAGPEPHTWDGRWEGKLEAHLDAMREALPDLVDPNLDGRWEVPLPTGEQLSELEQQLEACTQKLTEQLQQQFEQLARQIADQHQRLLEMERFVRAAGAGDLGPSPTAPQAAAPPQELPIPPTAPTSPAPPTTPAPPKATENVPEIAPVKAAESLPGSPSADKAPASDSGSVPDPTL